MAFFSYYYIICYSRGHLLAITHMIYGKENALISIDNLNGSFYCNNLTEQEFKY